VGTGSFRRETQKAFGKISKLRAALPSVRQPGLSLVILLDLKAEVSLFLFNCGA
jgi:hypothetical protein